MDADIAAVLAGEKRWAVVHGDCRDVLPTLPDKSVHHLITDPPYSEHTHAKATSGSRDSYGEAVDFGFAHLSPRLRSFVTAEAARLATRWSLVFSDIEGSAWWRIAFQARGLDYVRTGIWEKLGSTPQFTGDRPAIGAETIVLAHPKGKKKWNGGGSHAVWSHPIAQRLARDKDIDRFHPTQKPISLMTELVRLFTDPDEIILDTFVGSGTTGVAAVRAGRRFLGIELDENHAATARERIAAEASLSTVTAVRTGQTPLF